MTARKSSQAVLEAAARRQQAARTAPAGVQGGVTLTASAHCIRGCDWTAGPGPMRDADLAADKHTTKPPKHPTAVVAEPAGIRGAG